MADDRNLKLTTEEHRVLTDIHHQVKEAIFQVGQIELRKNAAVARVQELNQQAQRQIDAAAARLKFPQGTAWQMMPDGTVVLLDPVTGQPLADQTAPTA